MTNLAGAERDPPVPLFRSDIDEAIVGGFLSYRNKPDAEWMHYDAGMLVNWMVALKDQIGVLSHRLGLASEDAQASAPLKPDTVMDQVIRTYAGNDYIYDPMVAQVCTGRIVAAMVQAKRLRQELAARGGPQEPPEAIEGICRIQAPRRIDLITMGPKPSDPDPRTTMDEPIPHPGDDTSPKRQPPAITIRGSKEWRDWVSRGAEHCMTDVAKLIDIAVTRHLKSQGFKEPRPER